MLYWSTLHFICISKKISLCPSMLFYLKKDFTRNEACLMPTTKNTCIREVAGLNPTSTISLWPVLECHKKMPQTNFCITCAWKKEWFVPSVVTPTGGLEPPTTGLKGQRSTDWARQARLQCRFWHFSLPELSQKPNEPKETDVKEPICTCIHKSSQQCHWCVWYQ